MVTLVFKKHFTKGTLVGLTITDHLPFVNNTHAWEWIDNVSKNSGLDWDFVKVKNDDLALMIFTADNLLQAIIDTFEQWYEANK